MDNRRQPRLRALNRRPVAEAGRYVLYWMTAARRIGYNHGLEYAVERAEALGRPLLILEALRVDYPWASRRLHAFILEGMADNQQALAGTPAETGLGLQAGGGTGRGAGQGLRVGGHAIKNKGV